MNNKYTKLTLIVIGLALFVGLGVYLFLINQKDESKVAETISNESVNSSSSLKSVNELESATSISNATQIKTGYFNTIDSLHYATGTVVVEPFGENYKIKFANNFASAEGPDLYVYLSASQDFKNRAVAGLDTSRTINLGVLKNIKGEQEYLISKKDFEEHSAAIVIWCKEFGIQFSRADLN